MHPPDDRDLDRAPQTTPAPACGNQYDCATWLRSGDNAVIHDTYSGLCDLCHLAAAIETIRERLFGLDDQNPAWDALELLERNHERLAGQLEFRWCDERAEKRVREAQVLKLVGGGR